MKTIFKVLAWALAGSAVVGIGTTAAVKTIKKVKKAKGDSNKQPEQN